MIDKLPHFTQLNKFLLRVHPPEGLCMTREEQQTDMHRAEHGGSIHPALRSLTYIAALLALENCRA